MSGAPIQPIGFAKPDAYMVDCGNTVVAQGDIRFWRASRGEEAETVASMYGTIAVPLYRTPTPGRAAEPDTMVTPWDEVHAENIRALGAIAKALGVSDWTEVTADVVRTIVTERDAAKAALAASEDERCKMADTILRWQADSNDEVDAARSRAETAEAQLATLRAETKP